MAILSEIHVFPVKGLAGTQLQSANLGRRGLEYDRRWMLVDHEGVFLSQRELPELVFLQAAVEEGLLRIRDLKGRKQDLLIPQDNLPREMIRVQVWEDTVEAEEVGVEAEAWFTELLNIPCRLVFMPDASERQVDLRYARPGDIAGFSDGFPYLIASESSLADLNDRMQGRLRAEMLRFRPNLVIRGTEPWEEDAWNTIQIGSAVFRTPKPCARCSVVTIDPATASEGKEPLRTLASFRSKNNKVIFGANACWDNYTTPAVIQVGDDFTRLI